MLVRRVSEHSRVVAYRESLQELGSVYRLPLSPDGRLDPEAREAFISRASGWLAGKHHLDQALVRKILEQTACKGWRKGIEIDWAGLTHESEEAGPPKAALDLCFSPSLSRALDSLAPNAAVELFTRTDLQVIEKRTALFHCLAGDRPLYTYHELEALIRSFITYLQSNADYNVRTGWERVSFAPSGWPDRLLSRLYFTRAPVDSSVDLSNNCYVRRWTKNGPWENGSADDPGPSYVKAPHFGFLIPDEAARLESGRRPLLDLKLRILTMLLDHLDRRSSSGLWDSCIGAVTEAVSIEDALFYLKMDRSYTGLDLRTGELGPGGFEVLTGGLTCLLYAIGFIEKELSIGTFARTADMLGANVVSRLRGADGFSFDYFAALADSPGVDAALDLFESLEAKGCAFWDEYGRRVAGVMERASGEAPGIAGARMGDVDGPEDLRQVLQDVRGLLLAIANSQSGPFGATQLADADSGDKPETYRNLFREGADNWRIVYEGVEVSPPLRNSRGLHYLAFLLANPGPEGYYALQIIHEVDGAPYEPDEILDTMSAEQLSEYGLSVSGMTDAGEIMDDKYEADVRRRIKELEESRDLAEVMGSQQAVKEAESILQRYRRALGEGIGLGSRRRSSGSASEKARVAVTQAIGRVLRKLKKQHSALHEHLSALLQTGTKCVYNPSNPIDWNF